MDLVSTSVGMKQAEISSRVQIAVVKKMMDSQAQSGAAMLKLLDAAGNCAKAGDELVAAATGLGGTIDTYG